MDKNPRASWCHVLGGLLMLMLMKLYVFLRSLILYTVLSLCQKYLSLALNTHVALKSAMCNFFYHLRMSPLIVHMEWVLFYRVHNVAPPYFSTVAQSGQTHSRFIVTVSFHCKNCFKA